MNASRLPKGEPPGAYDEIHLAARHRDAERLACLLAAGTDPNVRNAREPNGDGGNTPLWFAAQGARPGGVPVARLLLDAGAHLNERCEYGTTALHMAASWAHLDTLQFLVARGADPSLCDDDGRTPLDVARAARSHVPDADRQARMPAVIDFLSTHVPATR